MCWNLCCPNWHRNKKHGTATKNKHDKHWLYMAKLFLMQCILSYLTHIVGGYRRWVGTFKLVACPSVLCHFNFFTSFSGCDPVDVLGRYNLLIISWQCVSRLIWWMKALIQWHHFIDLTHLIKPLMFSWLPSQVREIKSLHLVSSWSKIEIYRKLRI